MFALKLPNQLVSLLIGIKKESRFFMLELNGFRLVVELLLCAGEVEDSLLELSFSFLLECLLRK